jgi:NAD(P)-dependent dehydrogenase (short-subunit alcohol dehydrogenase family)
MSRLDGKIALISGAASGLGAAQATLFAREGAQVFIGDLQDVAGHALAQQIEREGGTRRSCHST